MANPNVLTPEARKILRRWVKQDFYIYMRPMSAVYAKDDAKTSEIYWSVSVEYRGMDWQQVRGEGSDLSKVIVTMSGRVPNRDKLGKPGYQPGKDTGWLAAKKAAEQQKADMKKARKKKMKLIEGKKKSKKKKVAK